MQNRFLYFTSFPYSISSKYIEEVVKEEKSFIEKVQEIVLQELKNENFSVHHLSKKLHLSRSQVHRKLKPITGMSAAIYIRHVRLLIAKELLQSAERTITDVVYEVGFKSPVYFSQVFREMYGKSPSEIRKQLMTNSSSNQFPSNAIT